MFNKFIDDEECYMLFGKVVGRFWVGRLDQYSLGEMSQVGFDPDYAFNNRSSIVGWVHTHPHFTGSPSITDNTTTKAWVCSLGKPLVCCIQGTDGLRAHWYMDDESASKEKQIHKIGKYLFGVIPNKNKIPDNETCDEHDERIERLLKKIGYKNSFQIYEKNKYNRPEELWQRYIHPISGRVYRWVDVDQIISLFDNDEEKFYTGATGWSKRTNELLEKEGCKIQENDIFSYKYVGGINREDPDYFKIEFTIKPRRITYCDLTDELKEVPYWIAFFREKGLDK